MGLAGHILAPDFPDEILFDKIVDAVFAINAIHGINWS